MIGFFRKYNRQMLAVFVALLLVVWLGGSALTSLLAPSTAGRVLAESSLGEIEERHRAAAAMETELLRQFIGDWRNVIGARTVQTGEQLGELEWVLLTREADRCGMTPSRGEVERWLESAGISAGVVFQVARRSDIQTDRIYDAAAKLLSIQRLAELSQMSSFPSESKIRVLARNQLEKVKVNVVSLSTDLFLDESEEISEDELQEHFEKYRDNELGRGMDFGYYQPTQIKVQYARVNVNRIAERVRLTESALERRAKEYWYENRETATFRRPPEEMKDDAVEDAVEDAADDVADDAVDEASGDGSEDESESAEGESAEPEAPKSPYYETFAEAREVAMDVIREQQAQRVTPEIAQWLIEQFAELWIAAETGENGYKVAPEGVLSPDHYLDVLSRLPANMRYEGAVTVGTTEFFNTNTIDTVAPALARISAAIGNARRSFRNVAFLTDGVEPLPDESGVDTTWFLSRGESSRVAMSDSAGNMYVYRVIDVKPAGPADSLDQVRERVVSDVRTARAYESARVYAERLMQSVTGDGLEAAYEADVELQTLAAGRYVSPPPLSRRRRGLGDFDPRSTIQFLGAGTLVDDTFVESCFDLGASTTLPKVDIIEVSESKAVTVVEWVETLPLREDEYKNQRGTIIQVNAGASMAEARRTWLDPTSIHDRLNFEIQ